MSERVTAYEHLQTFASGDGTLDCDREATSALIDAAKADRDALVRIQRLLMGWRSWADECGRHENYATEVIYRCVIEQVQKAIEGE